VRGTTLIPKLIAALMLSAAIPAAARAGQATDPPETRALALAAERDAKSATVTTPKRTSIEEKLYWYDNQHLLDKVFAGWHGLHLAGGDFPAGAGTKYGIGYDTASPDAIHPNRIDVSARAARSTMGYTRVSGSVAVRPVPAPIEINFGAQKYEFPQEDFFGFGVSSLQSNRTDYLLRSTEVGADLRWTPRRPLAFTAGVWRLRPETGDGTDSRFPSSADLFDAATLPGYGVDAEFVRTDVGASIDLRDNPAHPHAGGRYGVRFASYQPQDSSAFDFRRLEIDLQHYVPIPNRYRTLAFRASAVFTDSSAGNEVPFYYLPTLGGAQALRGFREFRFRDRDSVIVSAEYRWEAWWMLDGAFFVDVGEVAPSRRDFTLSNVETSYGVGFRLHSNKAFVSRLDLAFSREGFIPLLRFEHAF
jgi:hypothetical protein